MTKNNSKKILSAILFWSISMALSAQIAKSWDFENVEMDPTFITRLMPDLGKGITGGDGSISIDLKNGSSMFLWGDFFIGDVINNQRIASLPPIMGNAFSILSKDTVISYYKGTRAKPLAWLQPEPVGGDFPIWYWPGNGFVRNGILHLFMSSFTKSGPGSWDFVYVACDYFRLDANTFEVIDKQNFPAANQLNCHYGHAVLDDGEYIYSYGTIGLNGKVHIARAEMKEDKLTNWHFFNGQEWTLSTAASKPLQGIAVAVSEQFNVFKYNGKYVLVTQARSGNTVVSAIADKPTGPFYNKKTIFEITEPLAANKMYAYNTMVHPQYCDNGRILMCYNVNCLDVNDLYTNASGYQPRFFWMPMDKILNQDYYVSTKNEGVVQIPGDLIDSVKIEGNTSNFYINNVVANSILLENVKSIKFELESTQGSAYPDGIPHEPGRVEAEDFNSGGMDVAFYNTGFWYEPGGEYRDGTDGETAYIYPGAGSSNGYWMNVTEGDWYNYTINVPEDGWYEFIFTQSAFSVSSVDLLIDDIVVETMEWPTGKTPAVSILLTAGVHVFKISLLSGGSFFDYFEFNKE
ncbi:hypothetical protein AGMMS50262_04590 [Bacteroidia bacterium]|nr:hypothetical protein AGMMS50262_04590 [Bacteroidia bacterium]